MLTILGGTFLAKYNPQAATMLAAWLTAGSVTTVLLDQRYQWRLLYSIPFEGHAAIGVLCLIG
ncbi:MAG: hypothetical protein ABSF82_06775 [Candidatus Bathyarchaeia archaeon]